MKTNYESYLEGLKEGWELVWAVQDLTTEDLRKIFKMEHYNDPHLVVKKSDPATMLKLYKEYEKQVEMAKAIRAGDVAEYGKEKALVLAVNSDIDGDIYYDVITFDGKVEKWWKFNAIKKCNIHIEVLDWIKQGIEGAVVLDD